MLKEEITENEEVTRLNILNEIYKTENEKLKLEYRILFDEYMAYKNENEKKIINKIKKIFRKVIKK